jgi:hypothetical protein
MRTEAGVQDVTRAETTTNTAPAVTSDDISALRVDLASARAESALLHADNRALRADLAQLRATLTAVRERYHALLEEMQLLKRRLFIAKAERHDDLAGAQLAFDTVLAETNALAKVIEATEDALDASESSAEPVDTDGGKPRKRPASTPTGRRNLADANLPEIVLEIEDAELEGKAERIGTEFSYRLAFQRGGQRKLVIARAVYKVDGATVATPEPRDEDLAARFAPEEQITFSAKDSATATPAGESTMDSPTAQHDDSAQDDDSSRASVASSAPETSAAHVTPVSEATSNGTAGAPGASHAEDAASSADAAVAPGGSKPPASRGPFRYVTAPMPLELMKRGMLAPSMIAHILFLKYRMGVPFYRYEQQCAHEGVPLDRGTMCRYGEHVGATLGCIVEAAREEAIATAFCLATDATGVAVQPEPLGNGKRQPCKKGHFFVTLADKDHVFLDYQPKHTSLTAWDMFKGFRGYIQADAHAIYDALFSGKPPKGATETTPLASPPIEVACWAHSRRKHWEAAVCKYAVGVEGLRLIDAIFDADRPLAKLAPAERKARRNVVVRPLVDAYFVWAKAESAKITSRGLVATALGYSLRQEAALRRFLEDGRLRLDNNPSENALRGTVAVGRKAWLFYGSDDHATAAGNILSLVASCKLHGLDTERYFEEVIRILPYWPRDRYLELAPKYWRQTRARIPEPEWDLPIGPVTVPPPLPKEQPSPN